MKKKMVCGCMLTAILAIAGCGKNISLEQAREIVLEDAGVSQEEADFTKEKQDSGDYEFEFRTQEAVYEYEVKKNGTIESKEKEKLPPTQPAATQTPAPTETPAATEAPAAAEDIQEPAATEAPADPQTSPENQTAGDIGEEQAKAIALERAGLTEDQVSFVKSEKDVERGTLVYEIEFYEGTTEYSCDVNAATGEIVKYKTEVDHD